ncbi:MAG TPA: SPOR domain-containing protein [Variovorax sp.]
MTKRQSGNILIGLIVGLVIGLGIALGIAIYVTKVPIPFMTKTQHIGPEQDEAEARKNQNWDPNAPLAGKAGAARAAASPPPAPATAEAPPQPASAGPLNPPSAAPVPVVVAPSASADAAAKRLTRTAPVPAEANALAPSSDPIGDFARARSGGGGPNGTATDPFIYFVQAGAFSSPEDAEAQRAKLSLMGVEARVTERDQAGRTVYRVRAGPFNQKDDADELKERLGGGGLEAALVRVQR